MINEVMRIALIVESAGGGVGRHVLDLTEGLIQRGHEIHLLYSPVRADELFIKKANNIKQAIILKEINMLREVSLLKDFNAYKEIHKYICKNGRFDIIHGHSSKAGALVRLLKLRNIRTPIIYTPHALVTLSPNLKWLQRVLYGTIERNLGKYFSDAIIAVSNQEAKHALSVGLPSKLVNVIPNGVDIPSPKNCGYRTKIREELKISTDDIIVGFVGRLDYQKAPELLIQAFLLMENNPRAQLIFIGDGPQLNYLKETYSKKIRFLGYKLNPVDYLSAIDIFVLPSRYEGMSYSLLEAMSIGLPVIVSSVTGNQELVQSGVNGLVIPPDSPNELAKALEALISNKNLREKMGSCSAKLVQKLYSKERMIEQTVNLYYQLTKSYKYMTKDAES